MSKKNTWRIWALERIEPEAGHRGAMVARRHGELELDAVGLPRERRASADEFLVREPSGGACGHPQSVVKPDYAVDMLLYNSAVSGNCYKVRLLLAQLGLEYETVELSVVDRSNRARGAR